MSWTFGKATVVVEGWESLRGTRHFERAFGTGKQFGGELQSEEPGSSDNCVVLAGYVRLQIGQSDKLWVRLQSELAAG